MAFGKNEISIKNILPSKLFEIIERAGISTLQEIILLSVWDIKKVTNLNTEDITILKNFVNDSLCPRSIACSELLLKNLKDGLTITSGCSQIDKILNGGFRRGIITEIYGESGSGKTQLGIQAVAHNNPDCSIYICTEDTFPVKRLKAVKKKITLNDNDHNIYVEHVTEGKDLLSCVRVRLPKFLSLMKTSLIVIDSVAAPFRCESTTYVRRAEELKELAFLLLSAAQEYNIAVICINQVTASFDDSVEVFPSLGLAWSNMVSTRLWVKKSTNLGTNFNNDSKVQTRELSVVFASDLPNLSAKFIITSDGIQYYEVGRYFTKKIKESGVYFSVLFRGWIIRSVER